MKHLNGESFRTAYGDPSAALEARILKTLADIPEGRPSHGWHGRRRVIAAALAVCALLLGTALAIGLRSGLMQRLGLPEAAEITVLTPDPAASSAVTNMAVFTVESYLFDGVSLVADVRVSPKSGDVWVLPELYERFLDSAAAALCADAADMSIREYAASLGIRRIRYAQITGEISGEDASGMWIQSEAYLGSDGHIHFLLVGSVPGGMRRETDLAIRFRVLFGAQPREDTLTLHMSAASEPETQEIGIAAEALGVTIRRIDIIRTPAVVYYRITYAAEPGTAPRIAAEPVFRDREEANDMPHFWQGGNYSDETRTGVFLGVLPPSAEAEKRFTFRLLVNGRRSDPITVALPDPKQ